MNNHEDIYTWVSRYNEGDLKGEELKKFLQMLASDPEIRSETELDRELTEFLQDRDLLEFLKILDQARSKKRRGLGLNCLLVAAMLIILMALSGLWIYLNPLRTGHPMMNNGLAVTSDSQKSYSQNRDPLFLRKTLGFPAIQFRENIKNPDLLAANFEPLTYLEGMVGVVTRASHFCLLSPGTIATLAPGDTLRFNWKETGGNHVSFEVLNNHGECIISQEDISGASLTLLTYSWQEGLYYWKIINRDNLVSVGKIIIRR